MGPGNLIEASNKDINLAIQSYISPKERVVTAEGAKFLSVIQCVEESDDDFLAPLREDASYVTSKNSKQRPNPKRRW